MPCVMGWPTRLGLVEDAFEEVDDSDEGAPLEAVWIRRTFGRQIEDLRVAHAQTRARRE